MLIRTKLKGRTRNSTIYCPRWKRSFGKKISCKPGRMSRKHADALAMANPEDEPYASVQHMDQALSYIHHAINDLLQEKQAKLHSPADYEVHYDVVLPFKEDL